MIFYVKVKWIFSSVYLKVRRKGKGMANFNLDVTLKNTWGVPKFQKPA
jgi:hypothetical protein